MYSATKYMFFFNVLSLDVSLFTFSLQSYMGCRNAAPSHSSVTSPFSDTLPAQTACVVERGYWASSKLSALKQTIVWTTLLRGLDGWRVSRGRDLSGRQYNTSHTHGFIVRLLFRRVLAEIP
jgi:hypothetical protein